MVVQIGKEEVVKDLPQDHGSSGRLLTSAEKRRRDYRTYGLHGMQNATTAELSRRQGGDLH